MKSLGIDVGSSSVKVSLLDIETGVCLASATNPSGNEMVINSPQTGWAEQNPEMWWQCAVDGIRQISSQYELKDVKCIGIAYQMHGLVCLDDQGNVVRDAIIWCDSRAVGLGRKAFDEIGHVECLENLLNSPGNFTASKLAWVKENESDKFAEIHKFMLPGDYMVYRFSGKMTTTETGLSEQILWNFKKNEIAHQVTSYFGIPEVMVPEIVPAIGIQARTTAEIEKLLGIPEGTPITYRAGDQPNNAFSLNVLDAGEVAATGGTSGVVYGVTDTPEYDQQSRVNTFLHVNSTHLEPRYGVLLCINGTGIMNAWCRRNFAPHLDYVQMNALAETVAPGSDGVLVLPFGNGAERVLGNACIGASISGIDLNRHQLPHILRATQEGIAFSFKYGIEMMKTIGVHPGVIKAGNANLFLSPVFRQTLSTIVDATIELYDTDGALGAARGAALGAGIYQDRAETFDSLHKIDTIYPVSSDKDILDERYNQWIEEIHKNVTKVN